MQPIDPATLPPELAQQIADWQAANPDPAAEPTPVPAAPSPAAAATDPTSAPAADTATAPPHPFTVGQAVTYEAVDQVTQEKLSGVAIVVDAPTFGDGSDDNPFGHAVSLTRLVPDLYLDAGDVKAVAT